LGRAGAGARRNDELNGFARLPGGRWHGNAGHYYTREQRGKRRTQYRRLMLFHFVLLK
jgi:hypothetical protein